MNSRAQHLGLPREFGVATSAFTSGQHVKVSTYLWVHTNFDAPHSRRAVDVLRQLLLVAGNAGSIAC
jgi:hypothetical protein